MNYTTSKSGRAHDEVNSLPVKSVGAAMRSSAYSDTITFDTGAIGTVGVVAVPAPILNRTGDNVGSHWRKNPVYGQKVAVKTTAVVETAGSASFTVYEPSLNVNQMFAAHGSAGRYIAEITTDEGESIYGYIGTVTKTGDSYACAVFSEQGLSSQDWVGSLPTGGDVRAVKIYEVSTSISFTTGNVLTREVAIGEDLTEEQVIGVVQTFANGDFAVKYLSGRIYYKKAHTDTSDTISFLTYAQAAAASGGATEAKQDSQITQETAINTVLGATSDASVSAGATGSVSAKLRRLSTDLDAVKTSAASVDTKLTSGGQKAQIVDGAGNVIGSTSNALDVNIKGGVALTAELSEANDSVLIYGNDGSANRAIKTNSSGNVQVDVVSSALPTGAATAANQATANTSLGSIDAKLNDGNQKTQIVNSSGASIDGDATNGLDVDITRFPSDTEATGTISSLGGTVDITLPNGASTVLFTANGTFTGTLTIKGSSDGSSFAAIPKGSNYSDVINTLTGNGGMLIPAASWKVIRVEATAWSSGSASIVLRATIGSSPIILGAPLPTGTNTIGSVKLTDGTLTASVRDTGSSDSLNVAIVDASGNQITSFGGASAGDVAHDSADSGNPVKIGGKAADIASLPSDVAAGDRANLTLSLKGEVYAYLSRLISGEDNTYNTMHGDHWIYNGSSTASRITTATTTTIMSAAGRACLVINKPVASGVITVYDNTGASGTVRAIITYGATLLGDPNPQIIELGLLSTGCTIVTSAAFDITTFHDLQA